MANLDGVWKVERVTGFVDYLEPDGTAYEGRATFRGRELGRFRMRPIER